MNKAELIEAVATKLEVSKADAGRTIDTVIGTILEGVVGGECVVPGLGKLVKTATAAKTGGVERTAPNGTKYTTKDKPAGSTVKLRLSKEGKTLCE